jgi:hypothetical protein
MLQTDLEAQNGLHLRNSRRIQSPHEGSENIRIKLELMKQDRATELRVIRHDKEKEVSMAVTEVVNHRLAEVI